MHNSRDPHGDSLQEALQVQAQQEVEGMQLRAASISLRGIHAILAEFLNAGDSYQD